MSVRWTTVALAPVVLAACGSKPPAPAVVKTDQPAPKIEPEPPACITPPDVAVAITHPTIDGSRVQYCINSDDQCFALDLATGAFERLREPPRPTGDPLMAESAHVEMTTPELKICQSETCKTMTPKVLPGAATIRAATNADGKIAVFLLGDAPAGRGYAEVWDVAKTRRTAKFRYARGAFKCGDVAMLGEVIYVSASECTAPGARAALYNLRGRRIAHVGGRHFGTFGNQFVQVDGTTWAFLDENGAKLALQNIARGKVLKTIDTTALFEDVGADMGNPGESVLVRRSSGELAIIAGAPATGSVATVDLDTGEVKVVRPPRCGSTLSPTNG